MAQIAEKPKAETNPQKTGSFYDLYMLVGADTTSDQLNKTEQDVKNLIEKNFGTIKKDGRFVKKDLAYPIQKITVAYVASIYFWMEPDKAQILKTELSQQLKDSFLRFILTKTTDKILETNMPSERKLKAIDEQLEKIEQATKEKVGTAVEPKKISTEKPREEKERITIEDIDKKLDEIMGEL